MKKIACLLTSFSLIYTSPTYGDEYDDFNPIEYSYQERERGHSPYPVTDFGNHYRQNPCRNTCETAGSCYYNCSRAACLTVGVALGAAMIIAMIVIISKDGNSAHNCGHNCH
jgi:hypothetical protein